MLSLPSPSLYFGNKSRINFLCRDPTFFKGGSLSEHKPNWHKFLDLYPHKDSLWAKHIISTGLRTTPLLTSQFTQTHFPPKHNLSALRHKDFASCQIVKWLDQGVVEVFDPSLEDTPVIGHKLTVATDDFGEPKRLCLDARSLNDRCKDLEINLTSVPVLAALTNKNSLLAKFDLKSGFLHILLHKDDINLYCFEWMGKYYRFLVMPWGTKYATAIFQRLQLIIVDHLRELGIAAVNYIDDLAISVDFNTKTDFLEKQNVIAYVVDLFTSLGYFLSVGKCTFDFQPSMVFLGIGLCPAQKVYFIPPDKEKKLELIAKRLASASFSSVKTLQKWLGFLNSLSIALPNLGTLLAPFYKAIKDKDDLDLVQVTKTLRSSALIWLQREPGSVVPWKDNTVEVIKWVVDIDESLSKWDVRDLQGNLLYEVSMQDFFVKLANAKKSAAPFVTMFAFNPLLLAINYPKSRDDAVFSLRSVFFENCSDKVTFARPGYEAKDLCMTRKLASMIWELSGMKISIDLMGSPYHNFGRYLDKDIPFVEWQHIVDADFFSLRNFEADHAILFPSAHLAGMALTHVLNFFKGTLYFLVVKQSPLQPWWPTLTNNAQSLVTLASKGDDSVLCFKIKSVTQAKLHLKGELVLATITVF